MIIKQEDIKNNLRPIFKKYGVKIATLFGSYAKGNATEESDIDIYVDSGIHDIGFFELYEDVQRQFSKKVELIDRYEVDSGSPIEQEIFNTGVIIYEH